MEISIVIGLTIALIFSGFFFPKSKLIFYIQIVFLWIIIGGNIGGMDFNENKEIYMAFNEFYKISLIDCPLYALMCVMSNKANISFETFWFITSLGGVLLLKHTINLFTERKSFVLSLIYIYPMVELVIQKRNFLASSLIIFSFCFLADETKRHLPKYYITIILAGMIHPVAYIMLVIPIFIRIQPKKLMLLIITFIGSFLILFPIILKYLVLFLPAHKVQTYLVNEVNKISIFKVLAFVVWQLAQVCFLLCISKCKNYIQEEHGSIRNNKVILLDSICISVNIILCCLLPLYYYSTTFLRGYRNIIIINYIVLANRQNSGLVQKKKNFIITMGIIGFEITSALVFYIILGDDMLHKMFLPVFNENSIFSLLSGLKNLL